MRSHKYCSFVKYYLVKKKKNQKSKQHFEGCVFARLLVSLSLLPLCWLNIILMALLRLPLLPTQGMAEEGGILQPAVAYSQYHDEQLSSPAILLSSLLPNEDCLACCRGHSRDSSPSAGWEGTEVIPHQPGSDQGENSWECGCCTLQLCSHKAPSSSVDMQSIENLSNEGKQLCSVILTTEGVQVQFKHTQKKESLRQTYCVVSVYSNFPGLSI